MTVHDNYFVATYMITELHESEKEKEKENNRIYY